MKRWCLIALLLMGLRTGVQGGVAQQPLFRGATDLVTIDALVQRGGRPVTGLTAADFELFDNGVRQQVTLEATEAVPVDVTLVFDERYYAMFASGLIGPDLMKIAETLQPADRLRVIILASEVREVLPMQAPIAWRKDGLPELTARPGTASFTRGRRLARDGLDVSHDPTLRRQSVSDAVLFALARPSEVGRRHLVVVIAQGNDWSVMSLRFPLSLIAARSGALVQIGLLSSRGNTWPMPPAGRFLRADLGAAAAATGGEVRAATDAVSTFKAIFDDLRRSYLLRYTATGVPASGWHTVVVTTPNFPDYTIRARSGYLGR